MFQNAHVRQRRGAPKAALSILSELTPEQVAVAAASGDSRALTRASGVGPKLAQRIVLELKDKVKKLGGGERLPHTVRRDGAPRRGTPNRPSALSVCWGIRPAKRR